MRFSLVALILAATGGAAHAGPLDFNFTFVDNVGDGTSISGEIIGLTDNATSSAAEFLIDSATGPNAKTLSLPLDLVPRATANEITVSSGAVTGIIFNGSNFDFFTGFDYYFRFSSGSFVDWYDNTDISQPFWADGDITFTPVPEPASLAMACVRCRRHRRRTAPPHPARLSRDVPSWRRPAALASGCSTCRSRSRTRASGAKYPMRLSGGETRGFIPTALNFDLSKARALPWTRWGQ
ncbi:MAG: hypothetical protein WDN04_18720 [Rhodospirillales bacterium]